MTGLRILLLVLLIICTIAVSFSKNLLAAVGAGVTSILFFVTLKKIRSIRTTAEEDIDE